MSEHDTSESLERAVAAIGRIAAVPSMLKVLCQTTGMGFAAVARVTDTRWIACAVQDDIGFGLPVGGDLDVHTTLCKEVRQTGAPIAIDHATLDPVYGEHPTPKTYAIESYVSVPIVLATGRYFGNLCAIDPRPAKVNDEKTLALFRHFAHLISLELDGQDRIDAVRQELLDEKAGGALREQFIAVLGHDLRNPLSSIVACAHLIQARRDDPDTVADLAGRIQTNAQRMARLVDDLLDFARGRLGGGLQMATTQVGDLALAINDVLDELRGAHPGRDLRTVVDIDRAVPGDRGRIQQLVSNLVGNALTHGDPGGPVDVLAATQEGALVIRVGNAGPPIPAESLATLFDAFKRPQGAATRESGLGLGLFICQQIVMAHGGTLSVTSTAEDGTVFTARWPVEAARLTSDGTGGRSSG